MGTFNLTKEQCTIADELLRELCNKNSLKGEYVYPKFDSKATATGIFQLLENNDILKIHAAELDPLLIIVALDRTCPFINIDGGLTAVYEQEQAKRTRDQKADELIDKKLKSNWFEGVNKFIIIAGFVIALLGFLFQVVIPELRKPDPNNEETNAHEIESSKEAARTSKPDSLNVLDSDSTNNETN